MAGVKTLVVTQVFQRVQAAAAFGILTPGVAILKLPLGLGHRQHVHQVDPAGTRQLLPRRGQFQCHVQVIVLLWCVDPLPNPNLGGCQGAIRGGRAVGGAPGGADASLLRLAFGGILQNIRLGWRRLRHEVQGTNKLDFPWRSVDSIQSDY